MSIRLRSTTQGVCVRGLGCALALAIWMGLRRPARGQTVAAPAAAVTLDQLLQMSPAELDAIYRQGTAVAIPEGRIRGTAILSPGTRRTRACRVARG